MSTGVDMTTQEQLIEGMKASFPGESQAALARRAGLSVQRFNNYCTGIRTMDVDAVIGCAQALGWDVRKMVSAHEIETAPTPRVKAMWRKLAASAATLALAVGLALPQPAQGAESGNNAAPSIHYAKSRIRKRLAWIWLWLKSCLPQRQPTDSEIEA